MQIHRSGDEVTVYTRSLDDVTARLPEVVEATLALPVHDLIADGEAIALRPDGRPQRFQVTASRFGRQRLAADRQPLSVFFFDLLHLDGDRPARRADHRAGGGAGRGGSRGAPGRSADHLGCRCGADSFSTRRWPPATRV